MSLMNKARLTGAAAVASITLTLAVTAAKAEFPEGPVSLIVGYAAGGQTDILARAAAEIMAGEWGVPVSVVNQPGAGGAVALEKLRGAELDGYSVLFNATNAITATPYLQPTITYTADDFVYGGMLTTFQSAIVAPSGRPYETFDEFVEHAKSNPGMLFASLNPISRITAEEIMKAFDIDLNIVPVRGGGEMVAQVIGGQVDVAFSAGIHYRYPDEMNMLAAATKDRHRAKPDIPSLIELGVPVTVDFQTAIIAPTGTPDEIMREYGRVLEIVSKTEAFISLAASSNIPVTYYNSEAATAEIRRQDEAMRTLFANNGLLNQ